MVLNNISLRRRAHPRPPTNCRLHPLPSTGVGGRGRECGHPIWNYSVHVLKGGCVPLNFLFASPEGEAISDYAQGECRTF